MTLEEYQYDLAQASHLRKNIGIAWLGRDIVSKRVFRAHNGLSKLHSFHMLSCAKELTFSFVSLGNSFYVIIFRNDSLAKADRGALARGKKGFGVPGHD